MLSHDDLMNFYKTNFSLMEFHHYSLSELENMLSWERALFVDMINKIEKEKQEQLRDRYVQERAKNLVYGKK